MAGVAEILDAMAEQIRDVLTDVDWDFQVEPRMVLNPSAICIDMYPGDPASDVELAGFGDTAAAMAAGAIFNVRARVNPNDHEAGQEILLELGDPTDELSLVQALYDDPTLSGIVSDLNLLSESGFTVFTDIDPSKVYLGRLWRFVVVPNWT